MSRAEGIGTTPSATPMGSLESAVMDIVWDLEKATVRDVYRILSGRREIAYTTVMTAMSNLAHKKVLQRCRRGRAYLYIPTFSREEFNRSRVVELMDALVGRLTEPAMAYLVDRVARVDPRRLDELEQAIAELRKERKETTE